MTKEHLINKVAKALGVTQVVAEQAAVVVLESIKQGLVKDGKVIIRGFGLFFTKQKHNRMGRNPKTGEPAIITARKVISFRASKLLKAQVNE
jgi:nucleoid DNA-binding protein